MGVQKTRSRVLQIRAFQDGCGATQNRQSQLGNGFQGICSQGCVFPLTSLSSPVCLRSSRLFTSCVSAAFLRISPDLIFLSFLFFLTSSLRHVPFPFISSTFFSHVKTPAFLHSAPPPPNTNSCCAFALIIPQTRRAEERRLHLAP